MLKTNFKIKQQYLIKQFQGFTKMQELFEAQRQTLYYPQMLTLEAQKEKLKCPHKIQAFFVCIDPQCQVPGLMCRDLSCQCLNTHYKSHHIQLNRVLDSIQKHQKQLPQEVRKSYKATHQIINGMFDELSIIRKKLDLEQKYFGLTEQELFFMALIDQQKIDKICGKIVGELEKTFDAEISFKIHSKEDILRDFKLKKPEFQSLCKHIENNYTKFDLNKTYQSILDDSKIINQTNEQFLIYKWLLETSFKKELSSKLLFRASEHNFSANEFHKRCDGVENTLVIVKTQFDKVIGGFTPNKWHSSEQNTLVNDKTGKAFLFSLTLKEKYKCKNPANSTLCNKIYGPVFGASMPDLILDNNAHNGNNTFAQFSKSYNFQVNGTNKYVPNQQTYSLFSGATNGYYFKAKQYEVYEIKGM